MTEFATDNYFQCFLPSRELLQVFSPPLNHWSPHCCWTQRLQLLLLLLLLLQAPPWLLQPNIKEGFSLTMAMFQFYT